jgi:hypothetical protein
MRAPIGNVDGHLRSRSSIDAIDRNKLHDSSRPDRFRRRRFSRFRSVFLGFSHAMIDPFDRCAHIVEMLPARFPGERCACGHRVLRNHADCAACGHGM